MTNLTFNSEVSGNEAKLLLQAIEIFVKTDNPTVAFSNKDLQALLGDASGGDIYVMLQDFSSKVLSETVLFEDPENELFAVYPLVEIIGRADDSLFIRFNLSARQFIDKWRGYYLSKILLAEPEFMIHFNPPA